jgi:hypothetical protein
MSTQIAKAGSAAPGICLKTTPEQSVSLADFRGRPVTLAFYPLLADFEPKGAVARAYGAYDGVNPGADGILDALGHLVRRTQSAPAGKAAHP